MQFAVRALRTALPSGTLRVGVGLLILGVASYGFLALPARVLSPADFATLSVLWVLVYVLGPGLLAPLETEVSRAVADRRVKGDGVSPLVRRALVVAAGATVLLAVGTLAAWPLVVDRLLDGSSLAAGALLVSYGGMALAHVARGVLAGSGSFARYAAVLGVEGAIRLAAVAALTAAAVRSPGVYGLTLGGAMFVAVLVAAPRDAVVTSQGEGTPAPWRELSTALGWLLATSLLSQVLVNSGPVVVKLLASEAETAAAGQLLAGIVLARLPLFLFAAVQAALLPGLAGHLGAGNHDQFVRGTRRVLLVVLTVGAAMAVTLLTAGPSLLRLVFGPDFHLAAPTLAALAAGTGCYMTALVLNQSLVALRRYAHAAGGWLIGVLCFGAVIAAGQGLTTRVVVGYLVGTAAAAAALGWSLRSALPVR